MNKNYIHSLFCNLAPPQEPPGVRLPRFGPGRDRHLRSKPSSRDSHDVGHGRFFDVNELKHRPALFGLETRTQIDVLKYKISTGSTSSVRNDGFIRTKYFVFFFYLRPFCLFCSTFIGRSSIENRIFAYGRRKPTRSLYSVHDVSRIVTCQYRARSARRPLNRVRTA